MKRFWIALIAMSFAGVAIYAQTMIGVDTAKDKETL